MDFHQCHVDFTSLAPAVRSNITFTKVEKQKYAQQGKKKHHQPEN